MIAKNSIKQFLKPSWRKVLSVIIYLIIFNFILFSGTKISAQPPQWEYGFPLRFISIYSVNGISSDFLGIDKIYQNNLVIDLIFWYLISCAEIFLNIRIKKQRAIKK
jgi:hypothetical protein